MEGVSDEPENKPRTAGFQKGVSGNPGGRPKRAEELAAKIRDMEPQLLARLADIALNGEAKESNAAIKLLWGYGYGSPRQIVTDAEGNAVPFGIMVLPSKAEP